MAQPDTSRRAADGSREILESIAPTRIALGQWQLQRLLYPTEPQEKKEC